MLKWISEGVENMGDNLDIRRPEDVLKVNINQEHELNVWTEQLNVSKE